MGLAYMPFFVSDWIADTRGLSLEERGAYVEILGHLWNAKGGACEIPGDDASLAKLIGVRIDVWRRIRARIHKLLVWSDGKVSHAKLSKVYLKAKAKHEAAKKARADKEAQREAEREAKSRGKVGEKSDLSPTLSGLSSDFSARKSAEKHETGGDLQSDNQNQNQNEVVKRKKNASASPPLIGFKEFHVAFEERYERATGAKPSWDATTGKMVKDLLKKQPLAELVRRLDVFFAGGGPAWITERDLKTFAGHIDKFVAVAPPKPVNPENDFRRLSLAELRSGSWRAPADETPQKRSGTR